MISTARSFACASLAVLAFACDAPATTTGSAAPAATTAAAASKPAETTKPEAPAAPKEFTEEDGFVLIEKMADIFANNTADCDKMASELDKFMADNAEPFKKLKALDDKQTPEQKKAFDAKYKDRNVAMMKKMEPAVGKCAANAKLQEVMKKLPL